MMWNCKNRQFFQTVAVISDDQVLARVLFTISFQLIGLDGRQMRSLGAETVLVGDVVDGVSDVGFRIDIGEATADGEALILVADVHQLGGLLVSLAVGKFVTVLISIKTDVVRWSFLYEYRLVVIVVRGSSDGDGHEGAEGDDLIKKRMTISNDMLICLICYS